MEFKESTDKLNILSDVRQEIAIRSTALSMVVNIINAYLNVHSLTQAEVAALQGAIEKETNYVHELINVLGTNLGISSQPQVEETAKEPDVAESTEENKEKVPTSNTTSKKRSTKSKE